MARKKEDAKGVIQDNEKRRYLYMYCPTCGVKLHIAARICFKCRKAYNFNARTGKFVKVVIHGSQNPNDAIYSLMMNDVEKCFDCRNTQNGETCAYTPCFASTMNKGDCEYCDKFQGTRFNCCQEVGLYPIRFTWLSDFP